MSMRLDCPELTPVQPVVYKGQEPHLYRNPRERKGAQGSAKER